MSTADLIAVAAGLGICAVWQFIAAEVYRGRLKRERAAHAETGARLQTQFRREVIREWASKMPKAGKIVPDPYCPQDIVYVLNPDLCSLPPRDAA